MFIVHWMNFKRINAKFLKLALETEACNPTQTLDQSIFMYVKAKENIRRK